MYPDSPMWQALLAAAVAGSTGFAAKHFLNPNRTIACNSDHTQHEPSTPPVKISAPPHSPPFQDSDRNGSGENSEQIFRFSSSGSRSGSKNSRKKTEKPASKSSPSVDNGSKGGGSGRKFYVCLKKRKTGRNCAAKCGPCSSKDSSSFKYGLGVGIMYMMSAGKAEISRLNTAMEETAKVVKELKVELERRKSSHFLQNASAAKANSRDHGMDYQGHDDGEHASSVLSEEHEHELIEMDQLEAELELELQKLPWVIDDTSCHQHLSEIEVKSGSHHEVGDIVPISCEYSGVSPVVLNQKLSHLLIERQESQISELETELHSAHSKLQEKESELQGLKDCVKRLTSFSLSTDSDDEMDGHNGGECASNWDCSNNIGSESRRPVVGTKRPVDCKS